MCGRMGVLWFGVVCAFICVCMPCVGITSLYMLYQAFEFFSFLTVSMCGVYYKYINQAFVSFFFVARPTERQLRYHIAAKLGQHWRSVGSYLGLQQHQLDQAVYVDSKLEEKAMEALVMWLSGQGDSDKPRSWKTVLEALRLAGQNDMAAKLEKEIREGKLSPSQSFKSTHPVKTSVHTPSN